MDTLVTIRRARPDEAGTLTALAMRSKASNGYDEAFMAACADELTVSASEIEQAEVWVAERAGRPSGFVSLWPDADTGCAEVRMFFVEPAGKRQGIGAALWAQTEASARAVAARSIGLDADPFAVPFYKAMGMSVVGEAPSASIRDRVLPRMEKPLAV